ncbi:hypothetical protein BTVI_64748 [Pitangus sulphuratus]|nr:hypothetical protein BTVI_64748 [Pitangus sulphuratus]
MEKYSNLNNGGKANTPENFSIALPSTAKFVTKKVQRPTYGAPLPAEDCKAHLSNDEKVGLLKPLIRDLELLKDIDDMDHLDFYTPKDVQECGQMTLRCYQRELTLLEKEVEGQNRIHLQNIQKNLRCLELQYHTKLYDMPVT